MKKIYDLVIRINEVARDDFSKAQGMLDSLNYLYGFNLGWLAKRVVMFDDEKLKYGGVVHDAAMYLPEIWKLEI